MNRPKDRNHTVTLKDAKNVFDKVHHPFLLKIVMKQGIEESYCNIVEIIYEKPVVNITLSGNI